jgi:hypothetical protein
MAGGPGSLAWRVVCPVFAAVDPRMAGSNPGLRALAPGAGRDHPRVGGDHPGVRALHPRIGGNHPGVAGVYPRMVGVYPRVARVYLGIKTNHPGANRNHSRVDANHSRTAAPICGLSPQSWEKCQFLAFGSPSSASGDGRFGCQRWALPKDRKRQMPKDRCLAYAWHHFLFETLLGGMNTVGTSQGIFRTARGGSWTDEAVGCRAAIRSKELPGQRSSNLGFRVALVPSQ